MHPILIQFGPLKVYSFGVMVMLGFLAALWWATRAAARHGIKPDAVIDASMWIFIPALIAARLLFVFLNRQDYHSLAEVAMVWQGGLAFHGGLIGGTLGGIAYCRRHKVPAWRMADVIAPGLALAYGIGRIGCFLNGCCYGAACSLPWAMRFPEPGLPGGFTPPSHPAQLYSSLTGVAMFGVLAWLDGRRRFDGQTFLAFIALYSIYRFIIEFIRVGATSDVVFAGLSQAQIASVVMLAGGFLVAAWRSRAVEHRVLSTREPQAV